MTGQRCRELVPIFNLIDYILRRRNPLRNRSARVKRFREIPVMFQ